MAAIHRVSVSLSDKEYQQLTALASSMGIKPTTAAHRAILKGLVALARDSKTLQDGFHNLPSLQTVGVKPESALEPSDLELSVNPAPEKPSADESQAVFDKQALKELERVPKDVQRKLRADFGTLTKAVQAGVRAERYNGKWRAVQYG